MNDPKGIAASASYAEAYDVHYSTRDLAAAVRKYHQIILSHPSAKEAEYSRTQIHNITMTAVPPHVMLESDVSLTLEYLKRSANGGRGSNPASEKNPGGLVAES